MKRNKFTVSVAMVTGLALVAAACGDDDDSADESSSTAAEQTGTTTGEPADTSGDDDSGGEASGDAVCPTNVVIQTDWWPELEHGGTYQLIGPDGEADAANFIYSGPIADAYAVGGVETVEIRAGGDAVSFTPVDSLLATDDDIMLGYLAMTDVIQGSGDDASATVAVAKTLDGDPQMVMWDPEQQEVSAPEDIAASGAQVLHFDGAAYIDYMIGVGYMTEDQSNPSYGGSPDTWVAEGGNFFQQGFATNEVYKYENEIEWKDGAPNYAAAVVVRANRLEEFTPCLEVLVPAMQQAWIDYLADPTPMNDALIGINETYDTYWQLSEGLNTRGMELLEELGLGDNSEDGTYCSFGEERMQELHEILAPIFDERGFEVAGSAEDVYTNEFCADAPGR
jgi:hypothetical protein